MSDWDVFGYVRGRRHLGLTTGIMYPLRPVNISGSSRTSCGEECLAFSPGPVLSAIRLQIGSKKNGDEALLVCDVYLSKVCH